MVEATLVNTMKALAVQRWVAIEYEGVAGKRAAEEVEEEGEQVLSPHGVSVVC